MPGSVMEYCNYVEMCCISSMLPLVHLDLDWLKRRKLGGISNTWFFYEPLLVPYHPWNWMPLAAAWKLLVSVVWRQPWKWSPCTFHGHPWKWVQGSVAEMVLATVWLVWGGIILWDIRVARAQLFTSLKILHGQLQWKLVGNHICYWVHLWARQTRSIWCASLFLPPSRSVV